MDEQPSSWKQPVTVLKKVKPSTDFDSIEQPHASKSLPEFFL